MFRQSRTMNTLYNYARFFDLIKNGRELNARIYAAKLVKIDFSIMKKIFNKMFVDGFTGMTLGLFATLILGTAFTQLGAWIGGAS